MSETSATPPRITVDWNDFHQQIDGFGMSLAKQAHFLMNCAEPGRSQILDLLFSQSGAGLTIVRNQINSKSADIDPDYGTIEPRKNVFDFDHDEAQIWLLKEAKHRGVTTFIASAFSPPAWMKINNSAVDDNNPPQPERNRLRRDRRNDYAEYLARYVREYRERFDIEFYAISPANEPETSAAYQSCTWQAADLRDFIRLFLQPALDEQQVAVRLLAPESFAWSELGHASAILSDMETNALVQILGLHNYNIDPATKEPAVSAEAVAQARGLGKRLWMTEISSTDKDNPSIGDALMWAKTIHKHMVIAGTNAWLWWWGALAQAGGDNFSTGQGLIYFRHQDGSFDIRKRFWCLAQYSRFIRPGAVRVGATANPVDGVYVSAFRSRNQSTPTLVIVAINTNASPQPFVVGLAHVAADALLPYTTSASQDMQQGSSISVVNGELALTLAPQSVTTLVGDVTPIADAPRPHKIYLPHI